MKANPGAPIAPDQVIGRDQLIQDLWDRLEQQSLVLTAERRLGKTSVIRKMKAEPPTGQITIFRDLENIKTAVEFVESVYQDVNLYLSRSNKTTKRVQGFLSSLGGSEVKGFGVGIKLPEIASQHWKKILLNTFEDLVEHQGEGQQLILFWDEVPWMLQEIAKRDGQDSVTDILDTLRSVRQTHPSIRMVFTGSIGLHHVIDSFRDSGYSNPSTNDMLVVDIPPLDPKYAIELAHRLLEGESVPTQGREVAIVIAEAVDHVPYYIHHLVIRLKSLKESVSADRVQRVIEEALVDPQDQWNLQHYQNRLGAYYREGECYRYALGVLDLLSTVDTSQTLGELTRGLAVELGRNADKELVRTVTGLLKKDHYLVQEGSGYRFRFGLVQKYWQLARG